MFNVAKHSSIKKQAGFSMLELAIVLSVLTLLTIQFIPLRDEYTETVAEQYTLRGFYEIANAVKAFYVQGGSSWPADMDALLTAGLLPGYAVDGLRRFNNGFGNAYQLAALGDSVEITTEVNSSVNAQAIAREWGPLASYNTTLKTITVTALRPGYEVAHDAFFLHNGDKPMTGNIEMDMNNLFDANAVHAQSVETVEVRATEKVITETVETGLISATNYEYVNE
jgi:competence protein ComGC